VSRRYVPDSGDVVWLTFDPQTGHEQRGRRPALVLSPRSYNDKASLALLCPITTRAKGYPFEVAIQTPAVTGVVLADHLKSLDWTQRQARLIVRAPDDVLTDVRERIRPLLGL
jgi:mRNA interferase MazF